MIVSMDMYREPWRVRRDILGAIEYKVSSKD
jgi:hypothetical protein